MGDGREDRAVPPVSSETESEAAVADVPEEDVRRAGFYALLARVLARPMDSETLDLVRGLRGQGGDSEIGRAIDSFAALAERTAATHAEDEFTELFYGVGAGGELSPYGSYYLTGLFYDKPLAELRRDMERIGIARDEANKEPEDHIASLCEMMHGLIMGAYGGPRPLAEQRAFFAKHLAPWAGKFFDDLEAAKAAALYMPVGTIGRLFMTIEREGFEMAA